MFQLTELRGQIETCTSDIDLFDHVARTCPGSDGVVSCRTDTKPKEHNNLHSVIDVQPKTSV